jgi:hypothetical protein
VASVQEWDEQTWQAVEVAVLMHGVGPFLHHSLSSSSLHTAWPESFRQHLAEQYQMNEARVRRLQEDLVAILRGASQAGIAVMPLKGSQLSVQYYALPALRPMADLDLLVRPADASGMASILMSLGYELVWKTGSEHKYVRGGGNAVVTLRGEHEDNPRPVDVHTALKKAIWFDVGSYDLTTYLWTCCRESEMLGERVVSPAPGRFMVHLAAHANYHHVFQSGRLMHWLDLAHVVQQAPVVDPPDADWVYPVLRLAARGLPGWFAGVDLGTIAARTQPRLRRWVDTVPLDARCGLSADATSPAARKRWHKWWLRWHPSPQRLALAYGDMPLVVAYGQHLLTLLLRYMPYRISLSRARRSPNPGSPSSTR